jgi:plasmid stabilization system protein ParE
MRLRLTLYAEADIARTLRQTRKLFGPEQVLVYSGLIQSAIDMLLENPDRPSSLRRDEIFPGLRSFHIELAAPRRRRASHVLFFKEGRDSEGRRELVVLGCLHERMEPRRKLGPALRDLS